MHLRKFERVGVFVDGGNLHHATGSLGFDIDYKKFLRLFSERSTLVHAIYFASLDEHSNGHPLVGWLEHNGLTVVIKSMRDSPVSPRGNPEAGGVDLELSAAAMNYADQLDHIVLVTGDGDVRCLVGAIQKRGKRVSVIASVQIQPTMVSDELRREADQYIDIHELKETIARELFRESEPRGAGAPVQAIATSKGSV